MLQNRLPYLLYQGVNTHTSITSSTASVGSSKKPTRFHEIVTGAEPVAMQTRLTFLLTSSQLSVVLTSDGGEIILDGAGGGQSSQSHQIFAYL